MNGYVIKTEVGYSVYVGSIMVADVESMEEAVKALKTSNLPWNGKVVRGMSTYMPCQ